MEAWTAIIPAAAAAGLGSWGAFHPKARLFGPAIVSAGRGCALTFDDGPNPALTPKLLELLDRHKVRATFFLLGKYVEQNPALAAEIAAANHVIGNHTQTHPNTLFFSRQQILDELRWCDDAIVNATGRASVCVRPPF